MMALLNQVGLLVLTLVVFWASFWLYRRYNSRPTIHSLLHPLVTAPALIGCLLLLVDIDYSLYRHANSPFFFLLGTANGGASDSSSSTISPYSLFGKTFADHAIIWSQLCCYQRRVNCLATWGIRGDLDFTLAQVGHNAYCSGDYRENRRSSGPHCWRSRLYWRGGCNLWALDISLAKHHR